MENIYIALENLRSLYNIGAIFRTCSFFGVKNVLLVGYSGRNFDTKGKPVLHDEIRKSSLGSEQDLKIKFLDSSEDLLEFAQKNNLEIVAIEQSEKSIYLQDIKFSGENKSQILVFGNEVDGVSPLVLESADKVIEIGRTGKHNSLNVTTTCGIVLFWISAKLIIQEHSSKDKYQPT